MNPRDLLRLDVGTIRLDEPLKNHCTYSIGGPALAVVEPCSPPQVVRIRRFISRHSLPFAIIGDGSNLLCPDKGFPGVVIKISRDFAGYKQTGTSITAGAGLSAPRLASRAALAGLSGLEHIIGIPGTIGGLVTMNGGSNGQSIGDVINWVESIDIKGQSQRFTRTMCKFSYRTSRFQESNEIITRVSLTLAEGDRTQLCQKIKGILHERREKFPLMELNCGSVFVNDPKMFEQFGPPGKVIEDTDLKGFSIGDAQVSQRHANFLINTGQARAEDIIQLVATVRNRVFERTGIMMSCELRYLYPNGQIRPLHHLLETGEYGV